MDDADQRGRHVLGVEGQALLAAGEPAGLRRTSTDPAWAKARVTIANGMPETRRLTAPVSTAATPAPRG